MKGLLLSFIALVFCIKLTGQELDSFNYQAVVRDATGKTLVTKGVSFRCSILSGSTSGTVIYCENHKVITNPSGLISVAIGKGTEKTGNFRTIDWNAESYFLRIEIDTAGGTDFIEISTTQLLNITYESLSKTSDQLASLLKEDEFLVTRKFIGNFVDYRHTGPDNYSGYNIIWIKTTMDRTYGKISAYGKTCDFSNGDNLYLRRMYFSHGDVSGYWLYQIENDSSLYYRVSEFQYDKKVLTEKWFE